MKEKIAFPRLVELVADKAGTTSRMSELFLQELFATVSQSLVDGKKVKIKGLGAFEVIKSGEGEHDVAFVPELSLADAVNAPFSQFKPVELCDAVTIEKLNEIDDEMRPQEPPATENSPEIPELEKEETPVTVVEKRDIPVSHETETPELQAVETQLATVDVNNSNIKRNWKKPLLAGIAAAAVIGLIVYLAWGRNAVETTPRVAAVTDSVKPAPAVSVVTDTLTGSNVLTLMAKKHYGDQAFWAYIARENQAKYPNYRKIPAGAVLIIPPAEKYGINSDSKQSIKKANAEAMKLYREVKAATQPHDTLQVVNDNASKGKTYKQEKSKKRKGYKSRNKSRRYRHR